MMRMPLTPSLPAHVCLTPLPNNNLKVRRATPLCVGLSRLPDPRESATTIAFLCMPAAAFVSGQALSVDGAFSAHGFNGPCVEMP